MSIESGVTEQVLAEERADLCQQKVRCMLSDLRTLGLDQERLAAAAGLSEQFLKRLLKIVGAAQKSEPCDDCRRVVEYMNAKTGGATKFRVGPGGGVVGLHQRHREHGLDACLKVVDLKAAQWLRKEDMVPYFRPKTLFLKSNFEAYMSEPTDPRYVVEVSKALEERARVRALSGGGQ
jgi:uncharacterized phage protein (TIGR02220 family)